MTTLSVNGGPSARSKDPMPEGRNLDEGALVPRRSGFLDDLAALLGLGRGDDADQGAKNLQAPLDKTVRSAPGVRQAAASVMRIETDAGRVGSGWVAAPHTVVTNAHVVRGSSRSTVRVGGKGRQLPAQVVYFNAAQDLAILEVPRLRAKPLRMAPKPAPGTTGAALGFPLGHGYKTRSMRWNGTQMMHVDDAFGRKRTRRGDLLKGKLQPGNSGGPVVDRQGRVLTTIFAKRVYKPAGGYGVPNDVVAAALRAPRDNVSAREMRPPR